MKKDEDKLSQDPAEDVEVVELDDEALGEPAGGMLDENCGNPNCGASPENPGAS